MLYIAYRAIKGDPRDAWIRNFAVAFAATGGTTFKNADLTDANFTKARLKSTDFRDAILIRTCFKNTQKLDRIRPGKTLLRQPRVRDLLITGDGYKENYQNDDLRGANLDGANLNKANLKQCDLSEASLRATNLEWANLTEVSALQTNFTRCNLTGACLEAWNIDKTTILDNVDCQYVFLLEKPDKNGNRDRHPHDPDKVFQPGDFEQLYSKIMETVQLLLRNGVNSEAFKIAFQKIMAENPEITYDSIQGIEKKGKDVVVTVEVPKDADKGNIEHQFNEAYEMRLEAVKKTVLLEAAEKSKKEMKEYNKNLTEIAKLALTNQPKLTNIIDNKAMNNSPDNSQNITAGGDVTLTNSNANLREMSGKINNLIQQLPDQKNEQIHSIKELLSQLKTLIETDENLDNENQKDALEAVESLAEAANKPEDSKLKKYAKLSKNALIGIGKNLPHATKLVEGCNELLPVIAELLGLG
ncbi:pentapeptide repeat-containing protein [Crocosphaera sp.]|uniref:pentapeptide repeat-containing protein n=1 Tax=Crocosphaera sp. TaxID=2729996 RepID=UPI0026323426|nr:pentapeptide repeat-containing protein [Crocosphaera sp.]MDJ0580136.1 pentapeptide repeat-containing protein [Crocosphaera sp.]